MRTAAESSSQEANADPRCTWVEWNSDSPEEVASAVDGFEPLDTAAGHKATDWLKQKARADIFTVTHLLVSEHRLEGFITCRVSEATLTWSGVESLGVSKEEGRSRSLLTFSVGAPSIKKPISRDLSSF